MAEPWMEQNVAGAGAGVERVYGEVDGNVVVDTEDIADFYPMQDRLEVLQRISWMVAEAEVIAPEEPYLVLFPKRSTVEYRGLHRSGARGLKWRQPKRLRSEKGVFAVRWRRKHGEESLHRADLPFLVLMDFRWAACRLGGRIYRPTTGIATGSPGGPGEADGVAAAPETQVMRRALVLRGVAGAFMARHMDDRVRAFRHPKPDWVRSMEGERFYGAATKLTKGKPGLYAGLRIWVVAGEVRAAHDTPNEEALISLALATTPREAALARTRCIQRLAGGRSWSSRGQREGVLVGLLLYASDRALGPETHVLEQVAFMLLELRVHLFGTAELRRAVYNHFAQVRVVSPRRLFEVEGDLQRRAARWRQFARRQAPWLPIGVPGS
jgi:hypothetical protein